MKKIKFLALSVFLLGTIYCSALIGYSLYKPMNENEETEIKKSEVPLNTNDLYKNLEKNVGKFETPKITPSTKIKYEYYYKKDNITEYFEDVPPYFFINLTRNDLENKFKDWNIKSFSEKEVVMQKVLDEESTQHYILSEYDGYIAIFYEKEINGTNLKDITSIHINSFPPEEQEKIKKGIKIKGKEELIKILQDYDI